MSFVPFPVIDLRQTGRNIEQLRRNAGLSVRALQDYFGFEYPQAIYKWQHGECLPSVDNLLALSHLLGVPIEELLVCKDQELPVFGSVHKKAPVAEAGAPYTGRYPPIHANSSQRAASAAAGDAPDGEQAAGHDGPGGVQIRVQQHATALELPDHVIHRSVFRGHLTLIPHTVLPIEPEQVVQPPVLFFPFKRPVHQRGRMVLLHPVQQQQTALLRPGKPADMP